MTSHRPKPIRLTDAAWPLGTGNRYRVHAEENYDLVMNAVNANT